MPPWQAFFATYCYLVSTVGLWILPFGFVLLLWPFLTTSQGHVTALAFSIFLQNIFISFVASTTDMDGVFTVLQGTNYLLGVGISALGAVHLLRNEQTGYVIPWKAIILWGAVCSLYALYGYHQGGGGSALANFRNFTVGPLLTVASLAIGAHVSLQQTFRIFASILLIALTIGALEWFDAT